MRRPGLLSPDAVRAAKLSRVPGVTIAEACERFGVARSAVARARKEKLSEPSLAELALAALTTNGTVATGAFELAGVAAWISYVDRAEYSIDEVRALLEPFVASGQLVVDGDRYTLARAWP